jgi:uncharacterized protein
MAQIQKIQVTVAYSPAPRVVDQVPLSLPSGTTLEEALHLSGLLARHGLTPGDDALHAGIWGKARPLDTPLREADRVEIWRGLKVDPKEARRQRYQQHLARIARR